jgi:hypothetical protein
MSAEFTLSFNDDSWYSQNRNFISEKIMSLKTFSIKEDNEYRLLGSEPGQGKNDWTFDVRIFLEDASIFIEISTHPPSITSDLSFLFEWIRKQTKIFILDDDGEDSGW